MALRLLRVGSRINTKVDFEEVNCMCQTPLWNSIHGNTNLLWFSVSCWYEGDINYCLVFAFW